MTNKEKYRQAFSVLHPSGKISVEVEKMIKRKKTKKLQAAAVAASACCLPPEAALHTRRMPEASKEPSSCG